MKYKEVYFLTVTCGVYSAINRATVDLRLQSLRIQASEVTYAEPQRTHVQ
jgi:hypothetical protein